MLLIGTQHPISILTQQLTNLEQTYNRCSLQWYRWMVKGRDCASALHFFKGFTYRTDDWTKQLLRLKSWVIFGTTEQWMEFHRLCSNLVVFSCSYLFYFPDFYYLLVHGLCCFMKNGLPFSLFLFVWWFWVTIRVSSKTNTSGNIRISSQYRNLS